MPQLSDITATIVNYRTLDLTVNCVESFLRYYPTVPLILVDNGSHDDSTDYVQKVGESNSQVRCVFNKQNLYHGPALDQGIRLSVTRYAFTLDSDCEITQGGGLEAMVSLLQQPLAYAVGHLSLKNRYGFETRSGLWAYVRYIHPHALLLDKEKYLRLKPFVHHGAPCLQNMKSAEKAGYQVVDFPIASYIHHKGQGTCSRYGYSLGIDTFIAGLFFEYLPRWFAQIRTKETVSNSTRPKTL